MDIRHVTITFNIRRFANDLVRVITPEIRYDRVWVSHLFNGERKKGSRFALGILFNESEEMNDEL